MINWVSIYEKKEVQEESEVGEDFAKGWKQEQGYLIYI